MSMQAYENVCDKTTLYEYMGLLMRTLWTLLSKSKTTV